MVIEESKSLFFPSLITWLCKEAEVEKKGKDHMKGLKIKIHYLKKKRLKNMLDKKILVSIH